MPRLSKSQQEKNDDAIRYAIAGNLAKLHMSKSELASKCGMQGYATFTRRWNDPNRFTLGDLRCIANILNISIYTLLGIGEDDIRMKR